MRIGLLKTAILGAAITCLIGGSEAHASQVSTRANLNNVNDTPPAIGVSDQDTSLTAPSISSSVDYSGIHTNSFVPGGAPVIVSGSASAYSDLITGKLGAFAQSTSLSGTSAEAFWSETITFSIEGATSATQTIIPLKMIVDGLLSQSGTAFAGMSFSFSRPGALLQAQRSTNSAWSISHIGDAGLFSTSTSGNSLILDTDVLLQGANPTLNLSARLNVFAGNSHGDLFSPELAGIGTADYSHTAAFSWVLPAGVSYTSSSGAFLTAMPGAVPEPATWAMMIIGFGAIGAGMRITRRRRTFLAAA